MITQEMLDNAVREAYEWAHEHCYYAPTDQSFPVGSDGKMDCTGLILRALTTLGLVNEPLNCDQINAMMGRLGFVKTEDFEDVYRYHCFVQWVQPQWVGSEHVHHTYYSLGGDGQTISKYDTGSNWRIQSKQPFENVSANECPDTLVFKCAWKLVEPPRKGVFIKVGE